MKGILLVVRSCHRRPCLGEENMAWPQSTRHFGNLQEICEVTVQPQKSPFCSLLVGEARVFSKALAPGERDVDWYNKLCMVFNSSNFSYIFFPFNILDIFLSRTAWDYVQRCLTFRKETNKDKNSENLYLSQQVETIGGARQACKGISVCALQAEICHHLELKTFTSVYVGADSMRVKGRQIKPSADSQFHCSGTAFIQIHQKYFTWLVWCKAMYAGIFQALWNQNVRKSYLDKR